MNRVVIQHAGATRPTPAASWWRFGERVMVRCGGLCGRAYALQHTVDRNGHLEPSLECPTEGCGWHVMATLAQWEP